MNAPTSVGTIFIGLCAVFGPLALGAGPASAQAVYRCGDNSYGQQPCEGGRPVRADDARTPQQQIESQTAARREAALADSMEQSRLQREAQAGRAQAAAQRQVAAQAAAARAADKPQPNAAPMHRREVFVARVPGARKKAKHGAREKMNEPTHQQAPKQPA